MVRPLEYYSCELGQQGPTRVSEKSFSFLSFSIPVLGVAVRSSSALDMNHDQARLFPAQVQSASSEKCCPHSLFSFLFVCPRLAGPFQALVNGRLAASGLRASGLRPGPPRSSAHAFFHLSPWTQSIAQSAIRQQNPELAFFAPNRRRETAFISKSREKAPASPLFVSTVFVMYTSQKRARNGASRYACSGNRNNLTDDNQSHSQVSPPGLSMVYGFWKQSFGFVKQHVLLKGGGHPRGTSSDSR